MKVIFSVLVIVFSATSLVYWLPGISLELFGLFKIILLLITACIATLYFAFAKPIVGKLIKVGFFYVILLICIVLAVHLFALNTNIAPILSLVYILVVILIYTAYFENGGSFSKLANSTILFVTLLCIIVLLSVIFPNAVSLPTEENEFLFSIGFNVSRTGWSASLTMVQALIIFQLFNATTKKMNILFFLAFFILLITQFLSGGRGGLLASLLMFFYYVMFGSGFKIKLVAGFFCFIIAFVVVTNLDLVMAYLRIDRIKGGGDVSSGRFEQYSLAIAYLLESNFIPKGQDSYLQYFYDNGIKGIGDNLFMRLHNVWLVELIQFGILYLVVKLVWLTRVLTKIYKHNPHGASLLILALIPTLFEPSVIFIVVTNYLVFWVFFTYLALKTPNY